MEKKPIILILTSKDELKDVTANIERSLLSVGTHNVVVLDERNYDARKVRWLSDFLGTSGHYTSDRKVKVSFDEKMSRRLQPKKVSVRSKRIANAVKRFNPELILAMTPYAHVSAVEAKRKTGFSTHIIYMVPSFHVDKHLYTDSMTNVYIVENADMKAEMVKRGVPSKRIMTMGLGFDINRPTPLEVASAKQELGLPRTTSVFVNAAEDDGAEEILGLLTDQGNIINVVQVATNQKLMPLLRAKADAVAGQCNVLLVTREDMIDEYMSACDVMLTHYDAATIYKCFKLGKPVITFTDNEYESKEITYLVSQGLVIRAKENLDIVGLLYRLMQTDVASQYVTAGEKWTEMSSLDNISSYLTSYIGL